MREADCWHIENSPLGSSRQQEVSLDWTATARCHSLCPIWSRWTTTMSTSAQVESGIRWLPQAAL